MTSSDALIEPRDASALERIEDTIVAALREGVSGTVKVDAFPADVMTYDFAGLDAAALVHYKGSSFRGRAGPASIDQSRRMNFAIVLLIRNLRGHRGAYHALEDIRLALQGVAFDGAGPAEIVSDALISEVEGQWRWEIVIGLDAPAIARHRRTPAAAMRPMVHTSPPTSQS
ncbi:hypothetical protein AN189_02880 [Loktanella sp. 3ANDIMAR09]|uniref:Gp37 family protein n=1 Tax=Loktanella sp. 3ANDIMAR09 TaxID=1225657 RepID=UPI0006F93554|nr:Gp37 family protein [Loktanella sp. 3ANDIMAR09]KQI69386.1 hypothetical protein AN189_02880 [Loktanella sp. 3ANDIMAR09]